MRNRRARQLEHRTRVVGSLATLPPDWRWLLLTGRLLITAAPVTKPLPKEKIIQLATRFWNKAKEPDVDQVDLAQEFPYVFEAYQFYTQENHAKNVLDAAIVARLSTEQISKDLGIHTEVIRLYEYLYFAAREFHSYRTWMQQHCFPDAVIGKMHRENNRGTLLALAYHAGWDAVNGFLDLGVIPTDVVTYFKAASRAQEARNVYLAQAGRDVNQFTQRFIIDNANETAKVEILQLTAEAAKKADTKLDPTALGADTLQSLRLTVASITGTNLDSIATQEPRAQQLLVDALKNGTIEEGPKSS